MSGNKNNIVSIDRDGEVVIKFCRHCHNKSEQEYTETGQGYHGYRCTACGRMNYFNAYTGANTSI